jgi:dipeptidyl-peptidase-4
MRPICLFLIFLFAFQGINAQQKKKLSIDDFLVNNTFQEAASTKIIPMKDGLHYCVLSDGARIIKYNFRTGKEAGVVFDLSKISDAPRGSITKFCFSNDEQRILLETNPRKLYRHSTEAEYYVWDIYTQRIYPVSEAGPQSEATFSPDGERVAFVRNNNIFIKTIRFGTEYAVTTDGKKGEIINGLPDWVYEEEFSYSKAFEWSPDSKMLAYVRFDEREVPEFKMPMYKGMSPERDEYALYPGEFSMRYPKAGEKNSEVSAHVHDLKSRITLAMDLGQDSDFYLPRLTWTPDSKELVLFKLNRMQNEVNILYANPNTGDTRTALTEKNRRYIDEQFFHQFTYLNDGQHFVVMSERNGFSHLYLYRNNGIMVGSITSGQFDVTDFYGYDPTRKQFYYQAAQKSPLQREVYVQSLDGKVNRMVSTKAGTNKALFSANHEFCMIAHSSATTPTVLTVYDRNMKELYTLENNRALIEKIAQYEWPKHEFFRFELPDGLGLNGSMLKPSFFDPSRKYPVIVTQYSGPNSQQVADRWKIDWHYFLAEQGYMVVTVDPRGTAARGEEFRKCTYLQLGKLETDDLIDAAKYLKGLPYVDGERIGIWGWSYGGFTTALCMAKGNGIFNTGISVAPVTNWRFYDTVYTERHMRTPRDNPDGYKDCSPIPHASTMKGNYLLVHGTADDNVHAQNSYEFTEAMVQAGFQFDMHLYTNRNHSIYGGNTRKHLYNKILLYFDKHLKN